MSYARTDNFLTKKWLKNEIENPGFLKTCYEHVQIQLLEIDLYSDGGLDQ